MPNRYLEVTAEQLRRLRDGLDLLESLDYEEIGDLDLYLYGLTQSEAVVDAAKEAIADREELNENDVQLSEVAIGLRLSADQIDGLQGSGFRLRGEEFAYMGTAGEGIRSDTFTFAQYKPTISVHDFSQMAIALSVSWLDDFLKQYGNQQAAQIKQNVTRTEEATQPGVPATQSPRVSKLLSNNKLAKIEDILDKFLG